MRWCTSESRANPPGRVCRGSMSSSQSGWRSGAKARTSRIGLRHLVRVWASSKHLLLRAQTLAGELGITIQVRWAVLALESWLIGGVQPKASYCGLQRIGQVPANTETAPAEPKQWLKDHLRVDYEPRTQECLAKNIDLPTAKKRNQSLRAFLTAIRPAN